MLPYWSSRIIYSFNERLFHGGWLLACAVDCDFTCWPHPFRRPRLWFFRGWKTSCSLNCLTLQIRFSSSRTLAFFVPSRILFLPILLPFMRFQSLGSLVPPPLPTVRLFNIQNNDNNDTPNPPSKHKQKRRENIRDQTSLFCFSSSLDTLGRSRSPHVCLPTYPWDLCHLVFSPIKPLKVLSDFLRWILMASLTFSIFFLTSLRAAPSCTLSSPLVSLALCYPDFLCFLWGFLVIFSPSVHSQMWLLPQALLVLLYLSL